jgi:hypothetical protein
VLIAVLGILSSCWGGIIMGGDAHTKTQTQHNFNLPVPLHELMNPPNPPRTSSNSLV